MVINYRKINPNGFYLLQYLNDPSLRYVFMYGGSSSGKSFSFAQVILIETLYDGENTLVMRKVGASIIKTIYEDFKVACRILGLGDHFTFRQNVIRCTNGARIDFTGLDDPEKIKGISNYKRVLLEELTEFDLQDFKQIRKRLRGKAGQQILASWNPISATHWIKSEVFDRERWHDVPMVCTIGGESMPEHLTRVKSVRMNAPRSVVNARTGEVEELPPNMVAVQSTYLNNFWVVGSPDGTYGYYDEQLVADFEHDRLFDPDYYQVYALGEWGVIRTGSEFLGSFNTGRDTADLAYDPALPIHLSVDSNVLPYITTQFWQVSLEGGTHLRQIGELMAGNPDNTVRRAAGRVASRLRSMGYTGKVYLHGDASAKAANNIDDEKRSFMDLYISTLQSKGYEVEDMISSSNPSVAMSGEFANQVLEGAVEGVTMTIGRACSVSIDDYLSTQKDVNGGILKARVKDKTTMQTYEAHGHACFTGNTEIVTKKGIVPISEVRQGDFVMSEKGFVYVHNSCKTSCKSRYFSVTLCNKTLNVTYNHPVYTERGFVPVYMLRGGDELIIFKNGKICKEKQRSTTVSDFIGTLVQNLRVIGSTLGDGLERMENSRRRTSTGISGSSIMVKSLKGLMFITMMAIMTIIQSVILFLCIMANISLTTTRTLLKISKGFVRKAGKLLLKKPKTGTSQKKEENGIPRTPRKRWPNSNTKSTPASSVARFLCHVRYKVVRFAQIIAGRHGEETHTLTMKNVLADFAELSLLSTGTLARSIVLGAVPIRLSGREDVYNLKTDSGTYFANGVLVHNCDVLRYILCDVCPEQFIAFSNRRKRNLFGGGAFQFYDPSREYDYDASVVYVMPNVEGRLALMEGRRVGDRWHVTSVVYRDAVGTDVIASVLDAHPSDRLIVECSEAYFGFVREYRNASGRDVHAVREFTDMDRRIAATSDFVRGHVLFGDMGGEEAAAFMTSLMDYNKDSVSKQASALLSGFCQFVIKSYPQY